MMYLKKWFSLIVSCTLIIPLSASDLIEVLPVTNKIICLTFDDGYIANRGTGIGVPVEWTLNFNDALLLKSYQIVSGDDDNYAGGVSPIGIGRKSKIHDVSTKCDWNGSKCMNDYIQYHFIYLELPAPLENGKTYTIKVANLADNFDEWTFSFDDKSTRSVAIHTNHMGYSPTGQKRYAYVSQWMGDIGPLNIDEYEGARFDIYPVNQDGSIGASMYNGSMQKQKDFETGGPDTDKSSVGPNKNYVKSDVWECDFSDFDTPGEYILSIDSIGCSYPFRIREDAFHEAFYYAARAIYFERAITGLPEQHAGVYKRPEWTDRKLVYTDIRTMDLTDESGNKQKQRIFDSIDYSFDVSDIHGWYHDAGDWDGYFSHFRVPRSLMYTYELAPDNFKDGELNIPESQVENGYPDTHIPDILDEAVWLVDYFKNNIGPTGGIFGSRVHPDISNKVGLDNASYHEDQGFVFETEDGPEFSYTDYRTWIVHGEDPRDSYAFASIAAQYVHSLKIAETKTGEDYSEIMNEYQTAAENAYNWAVNNTLDGDEDVDGFIENRAAAAAWLYKITGSQSYLDQLKADLSSRNITASTNNLRGSKWAVWAYVTINGSDPLYNGTFDAQLKTDLIQAVVNYAHKRVTESIEDKNRSMRMGGDFTQPVWNGQATTPWILPAMVAYRVTGSQNYLDACFMTGDYFLGGNQMNYAWLTGVGHQHPIHILHIDSRNDGIYGNIPGVPPYSPRVLCDWMEFQGNKCDYMGPWDNDFYLLDGRIYPDYRDDNGNTQWPVHELWFDQYPSPAGAEFTIHQNIAPAAAAYGFLSAPNGDANKNEKPAVSISVSSTHITQGDELEIQVSANDADGRIYKTELYQNNRLVALVYGNTSSITWENVPAGEVTVFAKVTDNLGLWSASDTVTLNIGELANAPSINFNYDDEQQYAITGKTIPLDVNVNGDADTVTYFSFHDKIGEATSDPFDIDWMPSEAGEYKIRAVVKDGETGLTDQDEVFFSIKNEPFLTGLSVSVFDLKPAFSPDIFEYTIKLPKSASNAPPVNYEGTLGTSVSVQHAMGIDQRVFVNKEDRTTVIRVEEEGNPDNHSEYNVAFRLNTGAPPATKDTILFETFGNEDTGFTGIASNYAKFSSDDVADFINDSVSINEWWQVAPQDQGASGNARIWLTNLSDAGDTLHFTNIDISEYNKITGLSWWSFANTGWSGYFTKAPAAEISIDGGTFNKLFIPGEVEENAFNCQSKWGKLALTLDVPIQGSTMTFWIGTYDNQQWMVDDILLTTETGECYSTLRNLEVEGTSIDYDPDKLIYNVELSALDVPEVTYQATNEEAVINMDEAASVNQNTHPDETDRTTTVTVANCGEETTYKVIFSTTTIGIHSAKLHNLKVYPNPAQDMLNIRADHSFTTVKIFSITGTLVKSIKKQQTRGMNVKVADIADGMYVIKAFYKEELIGMSSFTK